MRDRGGDARGIVGLGAVTRLGIKDGRVGVGFGGVGINFDGLGIKDGRVGVNFGGLGINVGLALGAFVGTDAPRP